MIEIDFQVHDDQLREALNVACNAISSAGGRALLVGGCVRDAILGLPAKDLDVEVYGLEPQELVRVLSTHFRIDLVGQSFGVAMIHGLPIDISVPRRESKTGMGHKGFDVQCDPHMTPMEAASRRDFTINTLAYDPLQKEVVDPFNGIRDLSARVLRHTGDKFIEDPLRVLRGMQFAARFGFEVAPETVALCSKIEPEGLAGERIFEEWKKLILKGTQPSRGLGFLKDCGWVKYFPELEALIGCEQDPEWHPEGDVWDHTLHCMDAFARERIGEEWEDLVVGFAVLCHDFGKPAMTELVDGRIRSLGHAEAGEAPTKSIIGSLTNQVDLVEEVVPLVKEHMRPVELYDVQASASAIRRLARRVKRIDRLVRVAKADLMRRPPLEAEQFVAGDWLLKKASELEIVDTTPPPIVMGRHLIALGMEPGRQFGPILRVSYEAQLDGEFTTEEDGLKWVRRFLKTES